MTVIGCARPLIVLSNIFRESVPSWVVRIFVWRRLARKLIFYPFLFFFKFVFPRRLVDKPARERLCMRTARRGREQIQILCLHVCFTILIYTGDRWRNGFAKGAVRVPRRRQKRDCISRSSSYGVRTKEQTIHESRACFQRQCFRFDRNITPVSHLQ